MFSTLSMLGIYIALALSWMTMPASAQLMPGKQPSIILSKGMTIHRIEDPSRLPTTFQQIDDNRLLTPVPAGKMLMRFEDRTLQGGRRQLVLTEDGVWGYVRTDTTGLFETEPRLRTIYSSKDAAYVILADDWPITFPKQRFPKLSAPAVLTRGEMYKTRRSVDTEVVIVLEDDKRRDILKQNPGLTLTDVPQFAILPPEAPVKEIDVAKILPQNVSFDIQTPTSMKQYKAIYSSWRKAVPEPNLSSYKPCGELVERGISNTDGQNLKAEGSLGTEASWWDWVKLKLNLSAELARKSESTFKAIYKMREDINVSVKGWSIKTDANTLVLHLLRQKECKQNATTWYTLRSDDFGSRDLQIDNSDELLRIVSYEPEAGTVVVHCYRHYLDLMRQVKTRLDLDESVAGLLLSRISRISDWKRFLSRQCVSNAAGY